MDKVASWRFTTLATVRFLHEKESVGFSKKEIVQAFNNLRVLVKRAFNLIGLTRESQYD